MNRRQLNTRADKVKFLTDLFKGKQSIQRLMLGELEIILVMEGKVLSHTTSKGHKEFEEPVSEEEYLQRSRMNYLKNLVKVEIVAPVEED